MRILEIIPWIADEALITYEREFLPDDVDVVGLSEGPLGECPSDFAHNLPELLDAIVDAERQGYDAVVLACFGDPGVEIARELVSIPVLGPLNVSMHVSQMIGHRALLLVPEYMRLGRHFTRANLRAYGVEDRVVVRGTETPVPVVLAAYGEYKDTGKLSPPMIELIDVAERSARDDDIDVIVIGCGGLKWFRGILETELAARGHAITVINPLPLVVEMARTLVTLNLSHCRAGYPGPPDPGDRYGAC